MMADAPTRQPENDEPIEGKPAGAGKGLLIAFVAIVVLMETAMFFFLIPSAEEISALAEAQLIRSVQQGEEEAAEQASDENKVEEFNLGAFGETFSPIDTERTFRVELRLFGLVRKKNVKTLEEEFDRKEGRLRHEVRMRIRNSELAELQDNQLGLLERRILTKCNHLLDEDLLLSIGFKDYQLIEQ
jgi:hypothetical protein